MQQILSVLPIAALLLVALMVMRQVGKFARAAAPVPSAQSAEYALSGMSTPAIEATTNNLLALIGASEHGAAAASTPGLLGMGAEENLSVEDIKDRVHMPLEQLRKMANERPAVVGMLIKSMLLEDRR